MKAQWLEVWSVGFQTKRILAEGREEWDKPDSENVLAGKDGEVAIARLKAALLASRYPETEPEAIRGKPMFSEFRLVSIEHRCRVALFPGTIEQRKGSAP